MTVPRPRIGIVGATRNERELSAFQAYVEAIEHAGGEAVQVLAGTASGSVAGLDGVVLTGGPDVDPARYGEATQPETSVEPDPLRDALELPLVRAAVHDDVPVLAICRGIQVLNVSLGGTLYQDVDVQRDGRQTWSHQQRRSHPDAPLDAALHDYRDRPRDAPRRDRGIGPPRRQHVPPPGHQAGRPGARRDGVGGRARDARIATSG